MKKIYYRPEVKQSKNGLLEGVFACTGGKSSGGFKRSNCHKQSGKKKSKHRR